MMAVVVARDFDDNEFPLAYLITFRCYGTWLHGDDRGSMDPKHNVYGAVKIKPNRALQQSDIKQLKHPPQYLNAPKRRVVEDAVREVCDHRKYFLRAFNIRTNHVHSVVTVMRKPEPVLISFQAYSTRALREHKLVSPRVKPWSRHGSRVYLWKQRDVENAIEYVLFGQGDEPFRLDDD
ncbi:MAG: transposase [Pyrinomonadaceae bacterium]